MRHLLFTLKGCDVELLEDTEFMRKALFQTAKECNSTLLDLSIHKFEPQGFTGLAMLAESHISIHTWPEKSMAVCDAFTCGEHTTPEKGVEFLKERLKATEVVLREFERPIQ